MTQKLISYVISPPNVASWRLAWISSAPPAANLHRSWISPISSGHSTIMASPENLQMSPPTFVNRLTN